MRVLIVADEVWNDDIYGNNVLTNWFDGFPAKIAEIYCSPGQPKNNCCDKYFQLTDTMMLKSIVKGTPAGCTISVTENNNKMNNSIEQENLKFYRFMKSITGESLRTVRELLWCWGKYDKKAIKKFIDEFNPDVIFCPRMVNHKLLTIEKMVQELSGKPMVAFTGDDEYSLKNVRITPIYWIKKLIQRKRMRKQIPSYQLYYTHSARQAREYHRIFGISTKVLYKCGNFKKERIHTKVNDTIRIVYVGKLYCNRWKTLATIGNELKTLNRNNPHMILEIYTRDKISSLQRKALDDGENILLKGALMPAEIQGVYDKSDIVLHVESLDLKNKLLTKYSFSTKIIDCMASGCAIMAVCWDKQAGFEYLRKQDAAFTAGSKQEIKEILTKIQRSPMLITDYAQKAYECGKKNHVKENVQEELRKDLKSVIEGKL